MALQAHAAPLHRWTITGALTTMRVGGREGWGSAFVTMSAGNVDDSSELTGGGLGLFAGGHATAWLATRLGLVATTILRYTSDGGVYRSLSGGIAVRF